MSTRDLAAACQVSEASVVRFVRQLGYSGYPEFIRELREAIDQELTLLDRVEITELSGPDTDRLGRIISQEIDNLQQLYASLDMDVIHSVADVLWNAEGRILRGVPPFLYRGLLSRVVLDQDQARGADHGGQ